MYMYTHCMLGAKHGFAQSMDCAAQSMDPHFAQTIHGLRSACPILGLCKLCLGGRFRSHELLLYNDEEPSIVVG